MPLEKTEEIHKILQWQTIIYCLVKCSKKKLGTIIILQI